MREAIERRITELREEFEAGRRMQAELQERQDELTRTLLRISGAVQALGEVLAAEPPAADAGVDTPPPLRVIAAS